jgi:hypothetical protein
METKVSLEPEGYELLNRHIEKMEAFVNEGIVNREKAMECCRKIRAELYGLLQTLHSVCVVDPVENGG